MSGLIHQGTVVSTFNDDTLRIMVQVPGLYGESTVMAWPILIPRESTCTFVSCTHPTQPCTGHVHTTETHQVLPEIGATVWILQVVDGSVVWLGVHGVVTQSAFSISNST